MTRKPNTIRARIADEAISRVTRFFDGTLVQTLHEVLQNARRSGAASVAITYHRATDQLTVADDGRGITDPRTLLAFGKTGWGRSLQAAESPAGMGVFSLARRSPRIRSRVAGRPPWAVELGEDHFIGRAAAAITGAGDYDPAHGTEVTFSILPDDRYWTAGHLSEAVRHYPLPVSIDGRKPEQTDFLRDAVRIETWRGLRIGVFSSTSPSWATPNINFHGLQVTCSDLPQVHALPATDSSTPRTWWAMADVVDCPALELTLPARTAIIQTPFVRELVDEARRVIYRAIAGGGFAPRLGYETRKTADAAGIPLPEDPRQLTPWRPQNARDAKPLEPPRHPDLQHALLVDDDALDAAESQNLAWAARGTGTLGRYWETEDQLKGYAWYDALPRVVGVNAHVTARGRTETSTRQTHREAPGPRRLRHDPDAHQRRAAQPRRLRLQPRRPRLRDLAGRPDRHRGPRDRPPRRLLPAFLRRGGRHPRHADAGVPAADGLLDHRAARLGRSRRRRDHPKPGRELHPAGHRRRLERRHRDPEREPRGRPPALGRPRATHHSLQTAAGGDPAAVPEATERLMGSGLAVRHRRVRMTGLLHSCRRALRPERVVR